MFCSQKTIDYPELGEVAKRPEDVPQKRCEAIGLVVFFFSHKTVVLLRRRQLLYPNLTPRNQTNNALLFLKTRCSPTLGG